MHSGHIEDPLTTIMQHSRTAVFSAPEKTSLQH